MRTQSEIKASPQIGDMIFHSDDPDNYVNSLWMRDSGNAFSVWNGSRWVHCNEDNFLTHAPRSETASCALSA